jgi:hypothetical protein
MSRTHFDFVKGSFKDNIGNFKLKSLESNIVTVPLEMLLSKGNPMLTTVNRILLKIMESGLIEYWTDSVTSKLLVMDHLNLQTEKTLTMNNLKGGFILFSVGIGLSIVTFVGELVVSNWKRNKIHRYKKSFKY